MTRCVCAYSSCDSIPFVRSESLLCSLLEVHVKISALFRVAPDALPFLSLSDRLKDPPWRFQWIHGVATEIYALLGIHMSNNCCSI